MQSHLSDLTWNHLLYFGHFVSIQLPKFTNSTPTTEPSHFLSSCLEALFLFFALEAPFNSSILGLVSSFQRCLPWSPAPLHQRLSITLLCWFPSQLLSESKIVLFFCLLVYYLYNPLTVKLYQGKDPIYLFLCFGHIADAQQMDAEGVRKPFQQRYYLLWERHRKQGVLGEIWTRENPR